MNRPYSKTTAKRRQVHFNCGGKKIAEAATAIKNHSVRLTSQGVESGRSFNCPRKKGWAHGSAPPQTEPAMGDMTPMTGFLGQRPKA